MLELYLTHIASACEDRDERDAGEDEHAADGHLRGEALSQEDRAEDSGEEQGQSAERRVKLPFCCARWNSRQRLMRISSLAQILIGLESASGPARLRCTSYWSGVNTRASVD